MPSVLMPARRRPSRARTPARSRGVVRRWSGVLAASVLVCTAASTAGAAPAVAAPSRPAPVSGVLGGAAPIDYVALGDSFSAGPLIPAQRLDPLGCLRSSNNYPAFLAGYFDVSSYRDRTCSGAETSDLDQRRQSTIIPGPSPAPQVDALTDATDLVSVGIGGNDYGLFGSMIEACGAVASLDPTGNPCQRHFTDTDGVDTKLRDAAAIGTGVARVLRTVARRAPHAEVYVVGYPRLLPATGSCQAVGFAAGDYAWANAVEDRLNRSLREAAARTGATYVDLASASRGHDACAGAEAWVNGKTLRPLRAANFHPFLRGMRAMAQEIYRQVTGGRTAPSSAIALPPIGSQIANPTPRVQVAPSPARISSAWRSWSSGEARQAERAR